MNAEKLRGVYWAGSSRKDLRKFPEPVKDVIGFALFTAQRGRTHPNSKPLKGFGGASVLEVIEDYDGDTYRAVYTVKFADAVWVLHVFQKKSVRGIKTPKHELDLIRERLAEVQRIRKPEEMR